MRAVRRFEVALAGVIAGGASFAALAPMALSSNGAREVASLRPTPVAAPALSAISATEFTNIEVSEASRAVAAAVVGGELSAARFSAPSPRRTEPGAGAVSVTPTARADSGPAWSGQTLGLELSYAPPTGPNEPNWWIIGGAGRESYAVAPGGLREFTVAPVSAETTVGDSHLGVAMEMGDHAYASVGYVREVRKFSLGTEDWEEEEHYIGVGLQARW